jgi:hypothetical protein
MTITLTGTTPGHRPQEIRDTVVVTLKEAFCVRPAKRERLFAWVQGTQANTDTNITSTRSSSTQTLVGVVARQRMRRSRLREP